MFTWFPNRLIEAADVACALGVGWTSELNPPASSATLEACENALGGPLSNSHRAFLSGHDGAMFAIALPGRAYDMSMDVRVLSCSEMVVETLDSRRVFADVVPQWESFGFHPFVIVGAYGMSGDRCIASAPQGATLEARIADAFHETPNDWGYQVIASSFEEWLRLSIESFVVHKQLLDYWSPMPVAEMVRYLRDPETH